ncbi:ATP-grasp domain-containing protein [Magnetospirillum aberrantis]|uniref:ATP-grasp domain-containing protein n=1 Tax=Magnetospirillum aberrantis SpK TaxID=908842 RepID=A0A7C9UVP9_9PROT|nr:ATP-grasp domain-containing protein [Magnetospirillum aberrantis]NFV81166.1 ATP-grasp domain-containing protein [Magnetospirillum aberrantis SpK]
MTAKALIHIGGSKLQLPGLGWARAAGLHVVLTDRNPEAPGRALADEYVPLAGDDDDGLMALAGRLAAERGLAGLYCGSDFGLPSVARVSAAHGVSSCTPEACVRALDKAAAVARWRETGIACPRGRVVESEGEMAAALAEVGLPAIVKPVGSSGSRGVVSVETPAQGVAAFRAALDYADSVLVEELLRGRHFDVNGLFLGGAFHPAGMLERFFSPPPYHYPVWGVQPPTLDDATREGVYGLLENAARSLGIDCGPVKADVMVTERGAVVLEVSPRFHGDVSTSFVTPLAVGESPVAAWFRHLAGETVTVECRERRTAGWMAIFPGRPGTFRGVEGLDAARSMAGIERIEILKPQGFGVRQVCDNTTVLGFIWAAVNKGDDVFRVLHAAREEIHPIMEE